jgi:penicillin-binding protein 1C
MRQSSPLILISLIISAIIAGYVKMLPNPLFDDPCSTIIKDNEGRLLGAKISKDGQWRFPIDSNVPEKFKVSLLTYEDQHFYDHEGVNYLSLLRATLQNIKARRIVSGGSTLTMQLIRISRKGATRSISEKIWEMILSIRLENEYNKREILMLYSGYAPFGGNVMGLEAASWRYYSKKAADLTWSETATLAVLPNAPSMIYPGKNRNLLLAKRNRLLQKIYHNKVIDRTTYELSLEEPLPGLPRPLPNIARHLTEEICKSNPGEAVQTTLHSDIQEKVRDILNSQVRNLKYNEIHNACAIVVEVETGNVLAYLGNIDKEDSTAENTEVNMVRAPRSTGSILKPILFAASLEDGLILPTSLLPDVPTNINGFTPKNYSAQYEGAVSAEKSLSRSLNIPAVKLLQLYKTERFHFLLKKAGITTLKYLPEHYGLSLILGGSEANLWELTGVYSSMARVLNHFVKNSSQYCKEDFRNPNYLFKNQNIKHQTLSYEPNNNLSAGSIYLTFESMLEVNRPEEETGWKSFSSSENIAWKTGTSFGNRDAWAIGINPDYVVGVWAGNSSGEGRPNLTGTGTAAPILFEIFSLLPKISWFEVPYDDMVKIPVCSKSGYRIGDDCEVADSIWVQKSGLKVKVCPYHYKVHLSKDGKFRVNSNCATLSNIITRKWFVLPPVEEYFYKMNNSNYVSLPEIKSNCPEEANLRSLDFVYPTNGSKIFIPKLAEEEYSEMVFEAVSRRRNARIFWHLDQTYMGMTYQFHQMKSKPTKGPHVMTLIDDRGETASIKFDVVND